MVVILILIVKIFGSVLKKLRAQKAILSAS